VLRRGMVLFEGASDFVRSHPDLRSAYLGEHAEEIRA
jgi:ABC-type uncharacterized transport system ATPase subunit